MPARCAQRLWRSHPGSPAALSDEAGLGNCLRALAVADYLARATRDYRRQARLGRVPFAVEELLAAGVDNTDLCAAQAPAEARGLSAAAARARHSKLPGRRAGAVARLAERNSAICWYWRALGLKHLQLHASNLESARLQDMLLAWSTARRAHG